MRCQEIEIVTGDVIEYELPDDGTVVYGRPLPGADLRCCDREPDRLRRAHPRRVRIIYSNPVEAGRLERTGRAHLVRYGRQRNRPWTTAPISPCTRSSPRRWRGIECRTSPTLSQGLLRRLLPDRRTDGPAPGAGGRDEALQATIQITSRPPSHGSKVVSAGSAQDLRSLRAAFRHHHCVRLPRLLDGPLLDRVRGYVDGKAGSRCPNTRESDRAVHGAGQGPQLLMLLVNDPHLFEHVRRITGCERIGRFEGDIYRMMPSSEDEESWHGEIFGHHMVEMSVDLSTHPYSGGVLEVRDRHSQEVLHSEADSEPGDAVLIRLAPSLQHRVTAVTGDSARTVYTGQFLRSKTGANSKLAQPGAAV